MKIIVKQWGEDIEIYGYHIEDILSLIKEAYAERAKDGISFATLKYSLTEFLNERTDDDYWFLAFDDNHLLCGTARLTIIGRKGEICNFAVLPNCQGRHVGGQLLLAANLFAKERKLEYVKSYTAIGATSSVKCHCNSGFQIIGIAAGLNRNYSSYIFRNQITPSILFNSPFVKYRYYISFLKYKLLKNNNGQNTILGNLALHIKNLIV